MSQLWTYQMSLNPDPNFLMLYHALTMICFWFESVENDHILIVVKCIPNRQAVLSHENGCRCNWVTRINVSSSESKKCDSVEGKFILMTQARENHIIRKQATRAVAILSFISALMLSKWLESGEWILKMWSLFCMSNVCNLNISLDINDLSRLNG